MHVGIAVVELSVEFLGDFFGLDGDENIGVEESARVWDEGLEKPLRFLVSKK